MVYFCFYQGSQGTWTPTKSYFCWIRMMEYRPRGILGSFGGGGEWAVRTPSYSQPFWIESTIMFLKSFRNFVTVTNNSLNRKIFLFLSFLNLMLVLNKGPVKSLWEECGVQRRHLLPHLIQGFPGSLTLPSLIIPNASFSKLWACWNRATSTRGIGKLFFSSNMQVKVSQLCPTLRELMDYTVHGILQVRILEWVAFPFSRGIFPTQGLNPGLLHCRRILYQLSHKGSPRILEWVAYPFFRGSSQPRNLTGIPCIAGGFFTNWAIRKAPILC